MKTFITLLLLFGAFVVGGTSLQAQTSSPPKEISRDMLLLYLEYQNSGKPAPGPEWQRKSVGGAGTGWERRVTVHLRMSKAEGRKAYSLSLKELGTLPKGMVWIGPVPGSSAIEKGATIGNMPTSSGPMIMLLLDPGKEVLQWWEP